MKDKVEQALYNTYLCVSEQGSKLSGNDWYEYLGRLVGIAGDCMKHGQFGIVSWDSKSMILKIKWDGVG